jgi:hypothetical protein
MSKNRVEQEWLNILKGFADSYWKKELEEAHSLFDTPYPDSSEKDYIKRTTFLDNGKRAKLMLLKYLAQASSGAVHPTGMNTSDEKSEAAKLLKLAESRLDKTAND